MINQINVGVIGTGWCGGIRANAFADNPLVDKLFIAETNSNRLNKLKNSLNIEMATENWQELVNNKNIDTIIMVTDSPIYMTEDDPISNVLATPGLNTVYINTITGINAAKLLGIN